jgi:hypothetical protein
LWVENSVKLLQWEDLQEVGQVELGDEQPRSIGVLEVAGRPVLLVGSSRGMVRGEGKGREVVDRYLNLLLLTEQQW